MLFKLGSVVANFMMVPLAITYLGVEDYGIWLTISSILTWFVLFDIGMGNGLRNNFTKTLALGEDDQAQAFVSTAYFTVAIIGILLVLAMWLLNFVIDWTVVFNTQEEKAELLSRLMPILFGFFGLQLVAKLIVSIYLADQQYSVQNKVEFFGQIGALASIWLLLQADDRSLVLFGSIYMALPVIIMMILNLIAFNGRYKEYRPKLSLYKKQYLQEITVLGFRFFILQIGALVMFSTDNLIITQLFGPDEVVPYNIAFKYFSVMTIGYGILLAPFWSAFTEAYANKDMLWIRKSVSTIQRIWLLVPLGLLIMILASDWFYKLWLAGSVRIELGLTLSMALYAALITYNMLYVTFINGVGKIHIQVLVSVIVMIFNIPISVYLAEYIGIGSTGVILGTVICILVPLFLWRIQYYKIINETAKGLWNK
jgi:O-antigen/teichoic acid export membrane protein